METQPSDFHRLSLTFSRFPLLETMPDFSSVIVLYHKTYIITTFLDFSFLLHILYDFHDFVCDLVCKCFIIVSVRINLDVYVVCHIRLACGNGLRS